MAMPSTLKPHLDTQTMVMVSKYRKVENRAAGISGEGDWHPAGAQLGELSWGGGEGSPVIAADSCPENPDVVRHS